MAVKDISAWAHVNNASYAFWRTSGVATGAGGSGNSGTLYATPFLGPPGTLSQIAIDVNVAASGQYARCAFYESGPPPNLLPATLVADLGSLSVSSVHFLTASIGTVLTETNNLRWRVVWVSGGVQLRSQTGWDVLGSPPEASIGNTQNHITAPYTGNLPIDGFPTTFPTSGMAGGGGVRPTFTVAYSAVT